MSKPLPIMEHDADGRVRYLIANGNAASDGLFVERAVRIVPVVDDALPSLHRGPWFSGWTACLNCCNGWVAIAPLRDVKRAGRGLECLACGSMNSAPVREAWCSACGKEQLVAQPEEAPRESGECETCHAMAVFVEAVA